MENELITLVHAKTCEGYTVTQAKEMGFSPNELITVQEALDRAMAIVLWSENDGDGNTVQLEAHEHGFMISMVGDNYATDALRARDMGYIATWLSFDMLDNMRKVMETYSHLVEGEGHFKRPE